MLSKTFRLTGEKNFNRVQKEGRVYQSRNFGLSVVDRKDTSPSRFAFIVSKKVAGEAVDRNRIKRIMGEAVRMLLSEIKSGLDVVFLARPTIIRFPTDEIMKEVKECLINSKLLN